MGRGRAETITIDTGFFIPNGCLKLLETLFNIVALALTASHYFCWWSRSDYDYSGFKTCRSGGKLSLATTIIFLILTLLLFLLFLFRVPLKCGGKRVWGVIDAIHDAIAVVLYFVVFIFVCIYANDNSYHYDYMIALAVFCLLNFICYLLSLVFCVMELCGRRVG